MANKINKTVKGYDHYITREGVYSPQITTPRKKELPAGIYRLQSDEKNNIFFIPMSSMTDSLIVLPDTTSEKVVKEINKFWSGDTRSKFEEFGLVYKRGILLYGAPGTGKTCTIARVMEQVVTDGGIVLFNPGAGILSEAVNRIREIQPGMKVLAVFEEFDGICNTSSFLSLLDGELQIDNIVYIATTNYIDKIPSRIKNRPSRFATVIEIGKPSNEARTVYLTAKLKGASPATIQTWVAASDGMVIDQIKDLIVSVYCMEIPLAEAADKLNAMGYEASNDDDYDEYDDSDDDDDNPVRKAIKSITSGSWSVSRPASKSVRR